MPLLECTTLIPGRSPEEVFSFCLDGANFARIFPEPVYPMRQTDRADLHIREGRIYGFWHLMFGVIPARWRVRIAEVQHNHYFVDEMLNGPLRHFRHLHLVAPATGGTLYTDRVSYAALGGRFAEKLMVDRYMAHIFAARHRNMLRLLRETP